MRIAIATISIHAPNLSSRMNRVLELYRLTRQRWLMPLQHQKLTHHTHLISSQHNIHHSRCDFKHDIRRLIIISMKGRVRSSSIDNRSTQTRLTQKCSEKMAFTPLMTNDTETLIYIDILSTACPFQIVSCPLLYHITLHSFHRRDQRLLRINGTLLFSLVGLNGRTLQRKEN